MQLLRIWLGLVLFGVLAIYSVSIHESFTLTLRLISQGKLDGDPSNYFYFFRQIKNIVIGLVIAFFAYIIPIKFFQKEKNVMRIAIGMMLLQLLVFVPQVGVKLNGARVWINIPFLSTLQPAEFFKLGYVFFLSLWLMRKRQSINTQSFFLKFIILNGLLFFVFLLIPDLGSLLIMAFVGLIMCRYAGARTKYIAGIFLGGIVSVFILGSLAGMVSDKLKYIQKRVTYFLSSDIDPQKQQIWRQNQQALISVGGGWFWGKGYGKGLQKFWYIPEAQSDFIFSAYAEEVGMVGSLGLLFLYFYLGRYIVSKLQKIRNDHSKILGVGIISLIIVQVFVNIGVNLKIMPNTGLTLPFISYGGTAMMVNLIELVLLYNIIKTKD